MHLLYISCIVQIYFRREITITLGRPGFESRIVTMNPLPCRRGWAVEKTGHKQKWQKLKRWCINRPSYSYYLIYSDNMSQFRPAGCPRTKLTTLLLQDEPLAVSRCQDEFTSGSWGRWMAEQRVWIVRRQVYKQSGQSINTYILPATRESREENWRPRVGREPVQTSRLWPPLVSFYRILFRVIEFTLYLFQSLFSLIYLNWNYSITKLLVLWTVELAR